MTPSAQDGHGDFGAGSLFLADSRLAFMLLNRGRYAVLQRAFGVPPEQANLVTSVVALGMLSGAAARASRLARTPFGVSRSDVGLGAFLMRDAAIGVAGPATGASPAAMTLITVAVVGRVVLPAIRRVADQVGAAELRIRTARQRQYARALSAARAARSLGRARSA
jgi:hypothetical protein